MGAVLALGFLAFTGVFVAATVMWNAFKREKPTIAPNCRKVSW